MEGGGVLAEIVLPEGVMAVVLVSGEAIVSEATESEVNLKDIITAPLVCC